MTEPNTHVRFELDSRPENVALVRSALTALAEVAELGQELLTDVKTAVSEACNNVVTHAYGADRGPMTVTLEVTGADVSVIVRDHGSGITQLGVAEGHMGLGLGVMSALASRFEVLTPERGTEIRMCFQRDGGQVPDDPRAAAGWLLQTPLALSGDAVLWLQPASLLAPVLGRILRAYGAVSSFTADRADELPAVGHALSDFAAVAGDGHAVGVAIAATSRRLGLVSGPYPKAGGGEQVRSRARLEQLVEEFDVLPRDGQTTLSFTVSDLAAAPGRGS